MYCFGQTKIGTTNNEKILELCKYNNSLIYTYVEEREGLISVLQDFYCNINGEKIGPFSKQPVIITTNKHYYIEVQGNDSFGIIIDDLFYGLYEDLEDIVFSEDESKYCFKYTQNDTDYLFENGKIVTQKAYITEAAYSPNNQLYYCYSEKIYNDYPEIFVKTPNKVYGPFSDINCFYFSSNNDFYIEVEKNDYDDYYLINGKLYNEEKYKKHLEKLGFSDFLRDKNGFYYQKGNQRTPSFDKLEFPTVFSYGNAVILKAQKNNKSYVIKNFNTVYGPYSSNDFSSFHITPETNYLFYNVKENEEYHLYKDGEYITTSKDYIYPYTSANGKVSCFRIRTKDNKYWLVTGNEKTGPYDYIKDITISNDGAKVVYVGRNNDEEFIFEGIKKYGPYSSVYDIELSDDNKLTFSYADSDWNTCISFNQKQYGPYSGIKNYALNLKISNDGKHIAYIIDKYGDREKQKIIVDGKVIGEINEKEEYGFEFSKDNLHTICYSIYNDIFYFDGKKMEGKGKWWNSSFEEYGILTYYVEENYKTIDHLIIDGKDYIGTRLQNDFIYLDGNDIMYLKK